MVLKISNTMIKEFMTEISCNHDSAIAAFANWLRLRVSTKLAEIVTKYPDIVKSIAKLYVANDANREFLESAGLHDYMGHTLATTWIERISHNLKYTVGSFQLNKHGVLLVQTERNANTWQTCYSVPNGEICAESIIPGLQTEIWQVHTITRFSNEKDWINEAYLLAVMRRKKEKTSVMIRHQSPSNVNLPKSKDLIVWKDGTWY